MLNPDCRIFRENLGGSVLSRRTLDNADDSGQQTKGRGEEAFPLFRGDGPPKAGVVGAEPLGKRCVSGEADAKALHGHDTNGADPHPLTCDECRAWAEGIARLRTFGAGLPLPEGLRLRLERLHPENRPAFRGEPFLEGAMSPAPLPQMPLPIELRQRLRKIPMECGEALPAWISRSRDLLAASCLCALLLTAAVGSPSPGPLKAAAGASRDVTFGIREAGVIGARSLVVAGAALSLAMANLNRYAGRLMGRLGSSDRTMMKPPAGKALSAEGTAQDKKENPNGKRSRTGNRTSHE